MSSVHLRVTVLLFICKYCLPVSYQPPKIFDPAITGDFYYTTKAKVDIYCQSNGLPKPTFKWLRNGTEVEKDNNVHYDNLTGTLHFEKFTQTYEDSYRCVATNFYTEGEPNVMVSCMSPTVRLRQTRLDAFESPFQVITLEVQEHEYFVLACNDSKTSVADRIYYTWYDSISGKEVDLRENRLYVDTKGGLHFIYVLLEDRDVGGYTCSIHVTVGFRLKVQYGRRIILKVNPPDKNDKASREPVLIYSNHPVKARRFSSAILECLFSSSLSHLDLYGVPVQGWRLSSGEVVTHSAKYNFSSNNRQMTITHVELADEGNYSCYLTYKNGESNGTVALEVLTPPYFHKREPQDRTGAVGTDVKFECDPRSTSRGLPPDPPVWYVNSERIEDYDSKKFFVSSTNTTLTITDVQYPDDTLCVQCDVSNEIGTVTANACLRVFIPAKPWYSLAMSGVIGMGVFNLALGNLFVAYRLFRLNKSGQQVTNGGKGGASVTSSTGGEDKLTEAQADENSMAAKSSNSGGTRTDPKPQSSFRTVATLSSADDDKKTDITAVTVSRKSTML